MLRVKKPAHDFLELILLSGSEGSENHALARALLRYSHRQSMEVDEGSDQTMTPTSTGS